MLVLSRDQYQGICGWEFQDSMLSEFYPNQLQDYTIRERLRHDSIQVLTLYTSLRRRLIMPNSPQPIRVNTLHLQIRTNIHPFRPIRDREPHSQMLPGVLIPICNLIVLITRRLDDFLVMERRTGPDGVDSACIVVSIPTSTVLCPDCMLDELLTVLVEEVGNVLLGSDRFDVLALHLLDELDGVLGDCAEGAHDGAVFDRPGRADVGDEIGEFGDRDAEVRFWADLPLFSEVFTVLADDGKAWAIRHIEA